MTPRRRLLTNHSAQFYLMRLTHLRCFTKLFCTSTSKQITSPSWNVSTDFNHQGPWNFSSKWTFDHLFTRPQTYPNSPYFILPWPDLTSVQDLCIYRFGSSDVGFPMHGVTPKSSIFSWFSIIKHPFGGTPHLLKPLCWQVGFGEDGPNQNLVATFEDDATMSEELDG